MGRTTPIVPVPSPIELMERFDRGVVGHTSAKESLIGALRMHLMRGEDGIGFPPRVLLMGPRGVGKSALGRALIDAADLPSVTIDFGELSLMADVDLGSHLARITGDDPLRAPYAIVFLDGLEHLAERRPPMDRTSTQVELLRLMDGHPLVRGRRTSIPTDRFLIFGAVAVEQSPKSTAAQHAMRALLDASVPLLPELTNRFDALVPVDRLSAAQVAKSFALAGSPLLKARRLIASLGGTFEYDARSIESLAKSSAQSPVGAWHAAWAVDRLLEKVLRAEDPKRAWKL
jgi:ATP-dependent protease HslVU (ClpYQ) ATPase subunit